jgi:hypothetical protein
MKKFEANITYIKQNLEKLGFDPSSNLIPIFYTPYAPFAKYGDIIIIPSISVIDVYLGMKFGIRDFTLLDGKKDVSDFLKTDTDERAFPLDLSDVLSMPKNSFRIQDAIFKKIEDTEVTIALLTPDLKILTLFVDINEKIYQKIKDEKLEIGSIIRTTLYNVSGG